MASLRPSPSGGGGPINKKTTHSQSQPGGHPPPQRPPRGRRRPAPARTAKDVQREYELYRRQAVLLLGTALLSLALFLLFALPAAALVGLTVMATSLGACVVVASAAAKARYRLEMRHPLGLVRHLPGWLRVGLTERSLHDCLRPSSSRESLPSLSSENHHSSRDSLSSLSEQKQR